MIDVGKLRDDLHSKSDVHDSSDHFVRVLQATMARIQNRLYGLYDMLEKEGTDQTMRDAAKAEALSLHNDLRMATKNLAHAAPELIRIISDKPAGAPKPVHLPTHLE